MMHQIQRGLILGLIMVAFAISPISAFSESPSNGTAITVYKPQFCGCCTKWIEHLQENGFQVTTRAISTSDEQTQIREKYGVPDELASCHTAIVNGYVVEGHVPADVINRLLSEKPKAVGIAVPGMPMGSPGMEGKYSEPYDVLTFDKDGKTQVYTSR
jgi:hypothetical protein